MAKDSDALQTIGELSNHLGVAQHILRYWETRFPQLRPLKRAGSRRYYRPEDVALVERIHRLLNEDGYTIRGVQKVLAAKAAAPPPAKRPVGTTMRSNLVSDLKALRTDLADALRG